MLSPARIPYVVLSGLLMRAAREQRQTSEVLSGALFFCARDVGVGAFIL